MRMGYERGGAQAGSVWPCAQLWRPNSNFEKYRIKLHTLDANAQYTIVAMSKATLQYSVYDR